jgi:hypothetical protein
MPSLRPKWACSSSVLLPEGIESQGQKEVPQQVNGTRSAAQHQTPWHPYQPPWGQAPRHQFQAPWSHAPRVQASQHQRPQQRFVPANHNGNFKNKSRHVRKPQKVEEGQYHSGPPIWIQSMMEWMMQSYQQSSTGRQAWVKKDSHPIRETDVPSRTRCLCLGFGS